MLTIAQIESACESAQPAKLPRHPMESPELDLEATYYPFGFPAIVRSNSKDVMQQYEELWGCFKKERDTEPIRVYVQMVENGLTECPPEPTYRLTMPLMATVADRDNYSIVDLDLCQVRITISNAALRHRLYAQYFLLGTPGCCVTTRLTTPVHAGCVSLSGRGVLLCGDSGAGKSTLSYACARDGWTYTTDDGSFLLNGGSARMVTGDCNKVRFRPPSAKMFQELEGLEITPRAAGKPSIELATAGLPNIACAQTTHVDFIVFLNRRPGGTPGLAPYRKDVARQFMRQTLFGSEITVAPQYEAIDKLLAAEVFELRYTDFNWAVKRLRTLVEKGR